MSLNNVFNFVHLCLLFFSLDAGSSPAVYPLEMERASENDYESEDEDAE